METTVNICDEFITEVELSAKYNKEKDTITIEIEGNSIELDNGDYGTVDIKVFIDDETEVYVEPPEVYTRWEM